MGRGRDVAEQLASDSAYVREPSRRLLAAARDLAEAADRLLLRHDAVLLGAIVDRRTTTRATMIVVWDRSLEPRLVPPLPAHEGARQAAALVLGELLLRWPANAAPLELGVVSDGAGVAFSAEHPSPLAPQWVVRHIECRAPIVTILPFAATSGWTRLAARAGSSSIH